MLFFIKYYIIYLMTFILAFGQTSNQIKQARKVIDAKGLTEKQVRRIAKSRGVSDEQINKVLSNDKKKPEQKTVTPYQNMDIIENKSVNQSFEKDKPKLEVVEEQYDPQIIDETNQNLEFALQSFTNEKEYFGYDIFSQDPEIFQGSTVGAVDPDYLIGPGDEIIVMLWGETQFRQVLKVNREGFIFIPEIGQVFVNGLNLNLLESKLFRVLSQSYASLNPSIGEATTFLDISLGNLRPLRIQVLGEVGQPGAYTVSPSTTLFSSLYYFDGPTTLGSLRNIKLIRGDKEITSIDFYDYLLTGKKPKDEKLQLDDVVFIPPRMKTVAVNGEINRPGIYELKEGENLNDLLNIAGKIKITAYTGRLQVDRVVPQGERLDKGMDRMFLDVDLEEIISSKKTFPLIDGDKINIFSILEMRQNIVSIEGSVKRPGVYEIGQSLTLSELIVKADSVLGDVYTDRADIIRTNPDNTEELIRINLEPILEGDKSTDLYLKSMDQVKIYGLSEMVPNPYVSIVGHVKKPGQYRLQQNMTIYDLIFKSGSFFDNEFTKRTFKQRAELIRPDINNTKKEIIPFDLGEVLKQEGMHNIKLMPNDQIRIYSTDEIQGGPKYVTISGFVKKPGRYELFEKNMTLFDLIFKSVGLEDPQHKSKTYLERGDLFRYEENLINRKIITFNLKEIFDSQGRNENINLIPGDEIKIYSKNIFSHVDSVFIEGLIKIPGSYELKKNMKLKDLIIQAGGLKKNLPDYKVEIARLVTMPNESIVAKTLQINFNKNLDVSNNEGSLGNEVYLEPFDRIFIRTNPFHESQSIIAIEGAVKYPGNYTILSTDETIYDIINRAGGVKPNAYPFGSQFLRNEVLINIDISNVIKNKKHKDNMIVYDGDKIIIAKKPNLIEVLGEVNSPGYYSFTKKISLMKAIKQAGDLSVNADINSIYVKYPSGKSIKYNRWFSNPKIFDGSVIVIGKKPEEEPFDKTEYVKELTTILVSFAQIVSILYLAASG